MVTVVGLFQFGWWEVPAGLEHAAVVEPVDVFQGGDLDLFNGPPWTAGFDQFGLEQADDRFGQGVVIGIADATHRREGSDLGEALGERDRPVLAHKQGNDTSARPARAGNRQCNRPIDTTRYPVRIVIESASCKSNL